MHILNKRKSHHLYQTVGMVETFVVPNIPALYHYRILFHCHIQRWVQGPNHYGDQGFLESACTCQPCTNERTVESIQHFKDWLCQR